MAERAPAVNQLCLPGCAIRDSSVERRRFTTTCYIASSFRTSARLVLSVVCRGPARISDIPRPDDLGSPSGSAASIDLLEILPLSLVTPGFLEFVT
uniref:Uncharacterized protein n=1 Tax=Steinernema glaseri TaxID=37863 RepID=A0A1I8AWC0_9BILA